MDAFSTNRMGYGAFSVWPMRFARFCLAAFLACCTSTSILAAQQGSIDSTSTGSVDVTYVQGLNARINGFTDLSLGTWGGSGPLTANDNLCVARTGISFFGRGAYRILASGDGEPGNPSAFTLTNGANQISYDAFFNDQTGTTGRTQLIGGVALPGQSASGISLFFNLLFGCAVFNANVSIEVPASELSTAAGVYSGTLTLTMIPE